MSAARSNRPELDAYWMPFTANRAFKAAPRIVTAADFHHYTTDDGRRVLDAFSGLWTTGLGHGRAEVVEAVRAQLEKLDYAPAFQIGHPGVFDLATRLAAMAPAGLNRVFFTNSGSEAVDTALKIALGYQHARGKPGKSRLIARERGYHGVNLGGASVSGIGANRAQFAGGLSTNVSHLPTTHDPKRNAFSRGLPEHGAELADGLSLHVRLHGADQIAAVIVEPVPGSTGILPPPVGYLQKLRELCTAHDILLIFDEVITAFGRVGAAFASERFGVTPDIICTAKGLTNGMIPMGAVLVRQEIHDAFMHGPPHAVELFHGHTYSGHPVAAAAALACLDLYEKEDSFAGVRLLEPAFEARIHQLRGARHVIDVRNIGLMGAVELAPREGAPGARGLETHIKCFEAGVMIRNGADVLQFAPFLNATVEEIEETFALVEAVLAEID
jgi:beta-alanine--pyruvate transaminase